MKPDKIRFAQQMYWNPTPAEAALWERLRSDQLGVPFLFQECVYGYIVDFYCPPARLVVEVDGLIHQSRKQADHDAIKDRALRSHGLVILRLPSGMATADMAARIDRKLSWLQVKRDMRPPSADSGSSDAAAGRRGP